LRLEYNDLDIIFMKKKIAILGSTGSIGVNTLNVIREYSQHFEVVGLSARSNVQLLKDQIDEFKPEIAAISDPESGKRLKRMISYNGTSVLSGGESLIQVATHPKVDLLVSAVVGAIGLKPLIKAIEHGKDIALANKESLVMAGEIVQQKSKEKGVKILPVDSEHCAIFQCLMGKETEDIDRIILTASGGPFRTINMEKFNLIRPQDALKHPTWEMGAKITIDSATLMNKGLELIEAKWFFHVNRNKLDVVIHPESIIHSMVQFKNGSTIAQLSPPDMKLPIAFALAYPDFLESRLPQLNLPEIGTLTFYYPEYEKFPCLSLAFNALDARNSYAITLNAANEVAVQLFLEGKIAFTKIPELIYKALDSFEERNLQEIDDILEFDHKVRQKAMQLYKKRQISI